MLATVLLLTGHRQWTVNAEPQSYVRVRNDFSRRSLNTEDAFDDESRFNRFGASSPSNGGSRSGPIIESAVDISQPSVRRFPQYPPSSSPSIGSGGESIAFLSRKPQVISVLSGSGSPHHSVTWNPPPTINPPVSTRSSLSSDRIVNSPPAPHRGVISSANDEVNGRSNRLPHAPASYQPPEFSDSGSRFAAPRTASADIVVRHDNHNLPSRTRGDSSSGNANSPIASSASPSGGSGANNGNSNSNNNNNNNNNNNPNNPSNSNKKDDVVIYYYYYYDDEDGKNTTRTVARVPNSDTNLDTIPSLEGYDPEPDSRAKLTTTPPFASDFGRSRDTSSNRNQENGRTNDPPPYRGPGSLSSGNLEPYRNAYPTIPPRTSYTPSYITNSPNYANFFNNFPGSGRQPQDAHVHSPIAPVTQPPLTFNRPSTDVSVSMSVSDDNGEPVSNVFRYGSGGGVRPTFDSFRVGPLANTGRIPSNSFQPQYPGQAFRHVPVTSTQSPFYPPPTIRSNYPPSSGNLDEELPTNNDYLEPPRHELAPHRDSPERHYNDFGKSDNRNPERKFIVSDNRLKHSSTDEASMRAPTCTFISFCFRVY